MKNALTYYAVGFSKRFGRYNRLADPAGVVENYN